MKRKNKTRFVVSLVAPVMLFAMLWGYQSIEAQRARDIGCGNDVRFRDLFEIPFAQRRNVEFVWVKQTAESEAVCD